MFVTTDPAGAEANEADVIEQAIPVDEEPAEPGGSFIGDRLLEANEADVIEQEQTVPEGDENQP